MCGVIMKTTNHDTLEIAMNYEIVTEPLTWIGFYAPARDGAPMPCADAHMAARIAEDTASYSGKATAIYYQGSERGKAPCVYAVAVPALCNNESSARLT